MPKVQKKITPRQTGQIISELSKFQKKNNCTWKCVSENFGYSYGNFRKKRSTGNWLIQDFNAIINGKKPLRYKGEK